MGLSVLSALLANGVAFGSALTAVYGTVGAFVLRLAGSALLSAAGQFIAGNRGADEQRRDLRWPTNLPAYRFVYGETRAAGTVMPHPVVGEYAYGAWLISSRPSDGGFTLFLDEREVPLDAGDPFNFAGAGATSAKDPFTGHVEWWIGLGDQTQPPQVFINEAPWNEVTQPFGWQASDAAKGCTILYVKYKAGDNGQRSERWPSIPPKLDVEGKFCLIYDPRDVTHDPDDKDTWEWSDNQALCVMDALRENPFRPYQIGNIDVSMVETAADVADEVVTLNSGGSEPRYRVGGTLVFDGGEIEDLVAPILQAGAARLVRVGGSLGILPGAWVTPVHTENDLLGDFGFSTQKPGDSLWTQIRANYTSPARGYTRGDLLPWDIPGALAADGGIPKINEISLTWVQSPYQAMRVRNITGYRQRQQKTITGTLTPAAIDCIAGATVTMALPAPFDTAVDGVYQIDSIHPGADPIGEQGVALRNPVQMVSASETDYAWNPATDEELVYDLPYSSDRAGVALPGPLSVVTGSTVDLTTASGVVARIQFLFDPSTSSGVSAYEWQWRLTGDTYQAGGTVAPTTVDGAGKIYGYLNAISATEGHDIRVRTISTSGASGWREITGVFLDFALVVNSSTAGAGTATFNVTGPDSSIFAGAIIWRADDGETFAAAVDVSGLLTLAASATDDLVASSLPVGIGEFWLTPVTLTSQNGVPVGPYTLTIT